MTVYDWVIHVTYKGINIVEWRIDGVLQGIYGYQIEDTIYHIGKTVDQLKALIDELLVPTNGNGNGVEESQVDTISIRTPSSAVEGQAFTISGTVRDQFGAVMAGITVYLYRNGSNIGSVTTGSTGNYSKSYTIATTGNFTITATANSKTASTTITITPIIVEEGYVMMDDLYRGIVIFVWMPDGTPFTANFDGEWHTAAFLSTLQSKINAFLDPEPSGFTFTVTDQTTGQPLQGANCSLRAAPNCTGDAVTALTDTSGTAILSAVWFVPRSWGVSKTGYTPTCSNNVTPQLTAALELQLPNPQIKNVTYPPTATPAQEVTITWTVKNQGETTPHLQWTSLIDDDTDEPLHNLTFTLPAGEQTEVSATLLMPDRTWNLRIDAGYETTLTASRSLKLGNGQSIILPIAAVVLVGYILLKK